MRYSPTRPPAPMLCYRAGKNQLCISMWLCFYINSTTEQTATTLYNKGQTHAGRGWHPSLQDIVCWPLISHLPAMDWQGSCWTKDWKSFGHRAVWEKDKCSNFWLLLSLYTFTLYRYYTVGWYRLKTTYSEKQKFICELISKLQKNYRITKMLTFFTKSSNSWKQNKKQNIYSNKSCQHYKYDYR